MKIGLFFGSFNPIHLGHLAVAEYMAEHGGLNEVWLIVSPLNPLKPITSLLNDLDRLTMVKLAIEDLPKLKVSDVEFTLPKPSYTIHTIQFLKSEYPEHSFVLIIGEDNLTNFEHWKDFDQILKTCMVFVYPRAGIAKTTFHFHPKVKLIESAPFIDISATAIRTAVRNKEDVSSMLPESVANYIDEKQLL